LLTFNEEGIYLSFSVVLAFVQLVQNSGARRAESMCE